MRTVSLTILLLGISLSITAHAADPAPAPTLADVPYGPDPQQRLDFYKAESSQPTPLVFFLHGGAWTGGDKVKNGPAGIALYLAVGISVVSVEYRFVTQAQAAGIKPPVDWPMRDAARADGVHWTKPELGLVELNGSKRNNICLIEGEPYDLTRVNDFLSVLYEPNDPDPARRYKAAYIAHPHFEDIRGGMSRIGIKDKRNPQSRVPVSVCATSADGLSWKVVGDRPANAGGEHFEVSSLYRFGDFYYTTGQSISPLIWRADGSDVGRAMVAYRSPDFVTWSQAKAFAFARHSQLANPPVKAQQVHMGAGLWNRGNVLVGLYGMWQDAPEPPPRGAAPNLGAHADLGLIVSNDGIHFREPVPDFKVITHGKEGEWDDIALLQGHAFVNVGEQTMIWYSHWDTGGKLKNMEIGLATLRRDGFGHLSCKVDDNDALLITAPFTASKGGKLLLNVDGITPDAPLTVELLDGRDGPVAGWSGADAATITANGTRHEVVWPRTKTASLPADQQLACKVKFPTNSKAHVFALYITE